MEDRKRVIILVIIALILALTAIVLNVMDSGEVPTSRDSVGENPAGGQVGVEIQPVPIEDKLSGKNPQ